MLHHRLVYAFVTLVVWIIKKMEQSIKLQPLRSINCQMELCVSKIPNNPYEIGRETLAAKVDMLNTLPVIFSGVFSWINDCQNTDAHAIKPPINNIMNKYGAKLIIDQPDQNFFSNWFYNVSSHKNGAK